MAKAKVVILGGGVGGTLVANKLAKHNDLMKVTVVDATGVHHYQPGLLYVPFGWEQPERLRQEERNLLQPTVNLVKSPVRYIDTEKRQLQLGNGETLPYDYLIIGTGACPMPEEVPGLPENGHHFYTETAALKLRDALSSFEGGKIVVGIAGFPYKCPPAPLEFTLLLDDWLRKRGIRTRTEIVFISPLPQVFSIPTVSPVFEDLFNRKGIRIETFFNVEQVEHKRLTSLEGNEMDYDLLILIPPHRGSPVIDASGIGDKGGWIPTDKETLLMKRQERIFAIGDATDLPVSKSGAAAHFQAHVVVQNLIQLVLGEEPSVHYDGSVMCFVEAGEKKAMLIRFNYSRPPKSPQPSIWYWWQKFLINRLYFSLVPKGISPTMLFATLQGKFAKVPPFCGSELMEQLRREPVRLERQHDSKGVR